MPKQLKFDEEPGQPAQGINIMAAVKATLARRAANSSSTKVGAPRSPETVTSPKIELKDPYEDMARRS